MKENKTPKDVVKEKEEKVKPPKKIKEATTEPEKVAKKTKYQPEREDKKSEMKEPVAVPVIQEEEINKVEPVEAAKETVRKENGDANELQMEPLGETKNAEKKKPVETCTSNTDCQPGFCCQSKKGKQLNCNKIQLGLGQRCRESCMCKEGLVCHFEQSSGGKEKPGKNDKAPLGVCKPPEVVGLP
ncbi:plasma membrane-associated cation-binding protein 2-like [Limulus polyphemus]|uniref:Plasma membrane-associated cation-binding protein 2-like n=1 Tax=Limulus polyphemus TaxID=6850 RepID=A0ABM1T540_LIMPO|nr:plasma membrane-associated cation-binding protein 2-like [Limulus polyphemus]